MKKTHVLWLVLLLSLICLFSCSSQEPQQPAQEAAPSTGEQAQQAAAPAGPEQGAAATAVPLKDKYKLYVVNRASTPVTVSLNGEWVGQWDSNADVPLENVVPGKNELTVELPEAPEKEIRVSVYTRREGDTVYLMSLNFEGKSGTHTHTFVVR